MAETKVKGADEKFCESCGEIIKIRAELCPKCGVRQLVRSTKNRTTAGLLAIFLGIFGIHKFYLGQGSIGILYLLFFWTTIPFFIGLFEGISLLMMSDEKFAEKYPG